MAIGEHFRPWLTLAASCAVWVLGASPIRAASAPQAKAGEVGIEWVRISSGTFRMGTENSGEGPAHRVTVKSFQMAKSEVTNKQYRACVEAGACTAATNYGEKFSGDDQPVVGVDWNQAKAFSEWVGGRLPTEAEWEYAARSAGKNQQYPWGDEEASCKRAIMIYQDRGGCGKDSTWPVCSKSAGNTEQGLCDMAGNVWEWVQDWYHDPYNGAPNDGSAWESPAGSYRVVRGGSWRYDANYARAAYRRTRAPGYRANYIGFRPVRPSSR